MSIKQFGGKVTDDLQRRYAHSPNWKDGKFENLVKTEMEFSVWDMPKLLYKQFLDRVGREPRKPLPIAAFDKEAWERATETQIVWFGHSAVLLKLNGLTILIDPMLGPDAAPIAPFKSARYSENVLDQIEHFPTIDLLLMTHDHYDHLDMTSIMKLKEKVRQYYVAMGVGRHLIKWGIDASLVQEFDWWDEQVYEGLKLVFTPSRHFSGRGLSDRAKSLWGGWVIQSEKEKIYWSGDGGYGDHFKEVGVRFGPFDFGFMECGQYNEHWHQIHMYPEESVQAALDAKVKKSMAVHWAGFSLAMHSWKDPIERFEKEAAEENHQTVTPRIGEQFSYLDHSSTNWWEEYE